jgi:gluconolactonase
MAVDEKGNLYVAAGKVSVFSPEGRLLRAIEMPEPAADCAFGDGDLQGLYVTARTSVYRIRLDVKGAAQH